MTTQNQPVRSIDLDFEVIVAMLSTAIKNHEEELTALDQAIGDGDHGINMSRGFTAVEQKKAELSTLSFSDACKQVGTTLIMTVGGASGPLFGSGFLAIAKSRKIAPSTIEELAATVGDFVDAVKSRGKSDAGAKTMLDVLIPLHRGLTSGGIRTVADVRGLVKSAVDDTKPMLATKGRAAFLGKRSIGHVDPGAKSTALIIETICDYWETKQ